MTDEEFERLKAAEKDRLRAKQRFQDTLEGLKRQNKVQSTVRRMRAAANRLLRDNEDLVRRVRSWTAQQAARLEVALAPEDTAVEDELAEADKELREARADELVRQYKTASSSRGRQRDADAGSSDEDLSDEDAADETMPEKTIGRMRERLDD
jgi:hypothetical protein